MNTQNNQMTSQVQFHLQTCKTPNLIAAPPLNTSSNGASPIVGHVPKGHHQASTSFGGLMNEIHKQNFVISKSNIKTTNMNGSNANYDNLNWIFLKRDPLSHSHTGRLSTLHFNHHKHKKDLSTSFGGIGGSSDNHSIDSPMEKLHTSTGATNLPTDFEDILLRHIKQEPATLNDDLNQLNEHQNFYNVQDDDSPTQVLGKISHQVHDQFCQGAALYLNLTKINQGSAKGNDSWDSKSTNQDQERAPKINGFQAKISKHSNQNSARQTIGGVSSSNFQSFKKHAMKLPKVQMRSSLLQPYNNQTKTQSVPISPRLIDQAKYNGLISKRSNNDSYNEFVNNSHSLNVVINANTSGQQFALPIIDKQPQLSQCFLDTQDQTTQPSLQNRSTFMRETHANARQELDNFDTTQDILPQHLPIHNGDSFLTETKVENNLKNRFTLTNLRKKVLGSPLLQKKHYECKPQQQKVNTSSLSSNSKLCSSCHKASHQKQFSFEMGHIETAKNLNTSMVSDDVDEEVSDTEKYKIGLRLKKITELSIQRKKYKSLKNSDYDPTQEYNTVRDNQFFNRFSLKYNAQLVQAFDEADRQASLDKSNATLKQDLLSYMDTYSDIRRQLKEEALKLATPIGTQGQIKKIHIKKPKQEDSEGASKQDKMKNYGRWYLKPEEFNRMLAGSKKVLKPEDGEDVDNN